MLGLESDPSSLPKYFPNGEPTGGLGYVVGPDNRQAPMRVDMLPGTVRRDEAVIPALDARFAEVMQSVMISQGVLLTSGPAGPAAAAVDDTPEGRRCADAVWQVLCDRNADMDRGEVIRWVNELATTGWGRAKPFSIRAVGDALRDLVDGRSPGREVTKPRDGVYRAVITQSPVNDQTQGAA
jgi:hypothetical protein